MPEGRVPELSVLSLGFSETADALHKVAEGVIAPARKPQNEIALRQTPGGFGTPLFEFEGDPWQVRVEVNELVVRQGAEERRAQLASLAAAAAFVGHELLPEGGPTDAAPLPIDPRAAMQLADWYAFSRLVLAELLVDWNGTGDADPSTIQLWPEHFDIAVEAGSDALGKRANYGASPGDDGHAEPYLYVGPWSAQVEGDGWNGRGFRGAEISYSEIARGRDQKETALDFFRGRAKELGEMEV